MRYGLRYLQLGLVYLPRPSLLLPLIARLCEGALDTLKNLCHVSALSVDDGDAHVSDTEVLGSHSLVETTCSYDALSE